MKSCYCICGCAAIFVSVILMSEAHAKDNYVKGYVRSNGQYVQPHYRSQPNRNIYDNYSTQGNVNPYNGRRGYRSYYDQNAIPSNRTRGNKGKW